MRQRQPPGPPIELIYRQSLKRSHSNAYRSRHPEAFGFAKHRRTHPHPMSTKLESTGPNTEAAPITGSCLCGKVAFEVKGVPLKFLYCHCRSCQKSSGSIHAANLAFPEGSVTWTQGEDLIEMFVDTNENPGFPRCFCKNCGSPVPKLSRNRQFWVVPSGTLDSDPGMRPQANICWAEHAPWFAPADQIAKHDGPLA
ncbi:GFA family protein [Verrucomicrobium spinosum]|uniref:GFA family protein n=1 Tax=Verrucomicrobium spinosum TaxID=2736 RepID=UPI0009D78F5C